MKEELVNYIETEILPLYDKNDEGHNRVHVNEVIQRSFEIIEDNNIEVNKTISFVIAAYHDLGCAIDRKTHEKISSAIFRKDETIKQFFSKEEIQLIKEGIEDHRASNTKEPRSIYGKIITVADKGNIQTDKLIRRIYKSLTTGMKGYVESTRKEQIERIYAHMVKKFGEEGYAKIWIQDKKYIANLQKLRQDIREREKMLQRIEKIIDEYDKNVSSIN